MRNIRFIRIGMALAALVMLSGCWDKKELSESAFAQAIAIDLTEQGQILLTTHFYKPGGGMSEEGAQLPSGFNIRSQGDSLFEAVRDITIHLGRAAQWSHMRMILIGEETARNNQIQGIFDFFQRDHEPRESMIVAITEGEASSYLKQKSVIESTIGQQLREMDIAAHRYSGKAVVQRLLDTAIQLKSETATAIVPFLYRESPPVDSLTFAGAAVLKKGIMVDRLAPDQTEFLLMMRNEYDKGILEVSCPNDRKRKNTLENVEAKTKMSVKPKGETVVVHIHLTMQGSYGELRCLSLKSSKDELAEIERIRRELEGELMAAIDSMQKQKNDLLGVGNALFRKHPKLWLKWKKDWDRRFANADFEVSIDFSVTNSGMMMPKPY